MKEIVRVTRLSGDDIFARHCKPVGLKGGVSRRFWKVKERDFPIANHKGFSMDKGQYVEIEQAPGQVVFTAFLLFILPLILFLVLFQLSAPLGNVLQVTLGLSGLVLGLLTPFLLKRLGRKDSLPEILRLLSDEEAVEILSCNIGCNGCKGCG